MCACMLVKILSEHACACHVHTRTHRKRACGYADILHANTCMQSKCLDINFILRGWLVEALRTTVDTSVNNHTIERPVHITYTHTHIREYIHIPSRLQLVPKLTISYVSVATLCVSAKTLYVCMYMGPCMHVRVPALVHMCTCASKDGPDT
jgi:hypothetical protein